MEGRSEMASIAFYTPNVILEGKTYAKIRRTHMLVKTLARIQPQWWKFSKWETENNYLLALKVVDSLDNSGQQESNPDVEVSTKLVALCALVEERPNELGLGQVARSDGHRGADPPKLLEQVVLVRRRPEHEARLFRRRRRRGRHWSQSLVRRHFRRRDGLLLLRGRWSLFRGRPGWS